MNVAELSFDMSDSVEILEPELFHKYDCIVATVPSGHVKLVHDLEEKGFRFIEARFDISVDLRKQTVIVPSQVESMIKKTECVEVSDPADIDQLVNKITPDMFETDRI